MDILCAFDNTTAKGPRGMAPTSTHPDYPDHLTAEELDGLRSKTYESVEQVMCKRRLDKMKATTKFPVHEVLLHGGNGFASTVQQGFETGSFFNEAGKGVTVCLSGSIQKWDPISDHGPWDPVCDAHDAFLRGDHIDNDAERLAKLYHALVGDVDHGAGLARVTQALAMLSGHFSFVIHDSGRGTVLAVRDAAGTAPLYWGVTGSEVLLLSTRQDLLDECNPTAIQFPAGCVYICQGGVEAYEPGPGGFTLGHTCPFPGQLFSFARPGHEVMGVPRVDSKGVLNGSVFRVSSKPTIISEPAPVSADKMIEE